MTLEHGVAVCDDRNFLESSCTYKCNVGYDMMESDKNVDNNFLLSVCRETENWEPSKPVCKRKTCNGFPVSNVRIIWIK